MRFSDGKGTWYDGVLERSGKKECLLRIVHRESMPERRAYRVHIAIAPPKNMDRLEWFLEKAAEIGLDEITPVWCRYSARTTLRPDRLEKILLSAMKQSLQPFLPKLNPALALNAFLDSLSISQAQRFIGYLDSRSASPHLFDACTPGKDTVVLIGPEGDFSPEEVGDSLRAGFQTITLGPSRLRTETAALAATHIVALKNDLNSL
ncbi:MAG: 16S rRNA (uracil(1498)-N(3))-methyltransferase [Haliscomenobacter sp.]|nr:16S rRNA (uracil(1498)-N(3))-methyltransferase [Haliscomenobacter sp.]